MKFYPVDMWEYMEVLYLNDRPDGAGDTDLEVDLCGCYDTDREEWDDEKIRSAAEKAVSAAFGSSAILVWEA